jgi:hypothetical protein
MTRKQIQMTKHEMISFLRMAAVEENTVTAMSNAFDMGVENERDIVCSIIFGMIDDHAKAQSIVDTIRIRE